MATIDSNDLKAKGFLSPEVNDYRAEYLRLFASAFAKFEAVSSRSTAALFKLQLEEMDFVQTSALLFWMKCVTHCQAACILLERGMAGPAQALLRSAAEHLFFGSAILRDGNVLHQLAAEEDVQRRKQAEGLLKVGSLTSSQRIDLEDLVKNLAKAGKGISAYDAAQIADQLDLYQTLYRGLSLIAAHGTLSSIDSLLELEEGDVVSAKIVFGPSDDKVEWTLSLATTLLERGIAIFEALGVAA